MDRNFEKIFLDEMGKIHSKFDDKCKDLNDKIAESEKTVTQKVNEAEKSLREDLSEFKISTTEKVTALKSQNKFTSMGLGAVFGLLAAWVKSFFHIGGQ